MKLNKKTKELILTAALGLAATMIAATYQELIKAPEEKTTVINVPAPQITIIIKK